MPFGNCGRAMASCATTLGLEASAIWSSVTSVHSTVAVEPPRESMMKCGRSLSEKSMMNVIASIVGQPINELTGSFVTTLEPFRWTQ